MLFWHDRNLYLFFIGHLTPMYCFRCCCQTNWARAMELVPFWSSFRGLSLPFFYCICFLPIISASTAFIRVVNLNEQNFKSSIRFHSHFVSFFSFVFPLSIHFVPSFYLWLVQKLLFCALWWQQNPKKPIPLLLPLSVPPSPFLTLLGFNAQCFQYKIITKTTWAYKSASKVLSYATKLISVAQAV